MHYCLYTTILLIFHLSNTSNTLSNYKINEYSVESISVKYEINKSSELKYFRRVLFVQTIFVILTDLSSIKTILWGIKNLIPLNWYSLENSLKISQDYFAVFTNEFCAFYSQIQNGFFSIKILHLFFMTSQIIFCKSYFISLCNELLFKKSA